MQTVAVSQSNGKVVNSILLDHREDLPIDGGDRSVANIKRAVAIKDVVDVAELTNQAKLAAAVSVTIVLVVDT